MVTQRLHKDARQYMALLPFHVSGIPCLIGVSDFRNVEPWKGSPHSCDSAADFYGYTECEWDVLDRRGRKADWLARKLLPDETAKVDEAVIDEMIQREKESFEDYLIDEWIDRNR